MMGTPCPAPRRLQTSGDFAFTLCAEPQTRFSHIAAALFCLTLGLASCGPSGTTAIPPNDRTIVRQTRLAAPTHGFGANLFSADDPTLGDEIVAYAQAQHGVDRDPATIVDSWGMRGEPYDARAQFTQ